MAVGVDHRECLEGGGYLCVARGYKGTSGSTSWRHFSSRPPVESGPIQEPTQS
jgi:hypothetical protein